MVPAAPCRRRAAGDRAASSSTRRSRRRRGGGTARLEQGRGSPRGCLPPEEFVAAARALLDKVESEIRGAAEGGGAAGELVVRVEPSDDLRWGGGAYVLAADGGTAQTVTLRTRKRG